jgi:transcriptional regulator with GAF, ATPase, and Fis domain
MLTVVLAFDQEVTAAARASVRQGLIAEGLACVEPPVVTSEHDAPVVVVAETEAAARGAVQRFRDAGCARLLAILTAEVPAGAAARLLVEGCGDVAAWSSGPACRIARRLERWQRVDQLVDDPVVGAGLAGEAPSFRNFLRELVEVAAFSQAGVLLLGESGTGKEAAARVVHALDRRVEKGEMLTVDCTTLTPELLGSELFGHERGAFTGATSSRDGAVGLADGGTLFLDEVGELPLALQPQLLRVLQERTYKPVGANYWKTSEFRLVCATNRALETEVSLGRFRGDLYHRISASVVQVPPLRERPGDVPLLARLFLNRLLPAAAPVDLDEELEAHLVARSYSGNVRELFRLMEALAVHHPGVGRAGLADLPAVERERALGAIVNQGWCDEGFEVAIRRALLLGASAHEVEDATRDTVKRLAIEHAGGNLPLAARRLGLSERALQKWRAEVQATDRGVSRTEDPANQC